MLSKELIEHIKTLPKPVYFTAEEEAYRRGYSQGFYAARTRSDVDYEIVYAWRHSEEQTCPPGSGFENQHIHGLEQEKDPRFDKD